MTTTRAQSRAETTARILASARRQIAEKGAGALSMRAVARDVDMVSSAVFRYFPTKEALLTEMILESYGHLADAIEAAMDGRRGAEGWRRGALALRAWAMSVPHEFQLIYGTPIPGYKAPRETIPAAVRVVQPFIDIAREATRPLPDDLAEDLTAEGGLAADEAAALAVTLAELSQIVGFLTLELGGHLVGGVGDTERFFAHLVERQVAGLWLDGSHART